MKFRRELNMKIRAWFKGIRGQLLVIAIFPVIGFIVSNFVSLNGIGKINKLLDSAHHEVIPHTKNLNSLFISRNRFGYHIWAAIALADRVDLKKQRLEMARQAMDDWKMYWNLLDRESHAPETEKHFSFIKENKDHYLSMLEHTIALTDDGSKESLQKAESLLLNEIWVMGGKIGVENAAIAKFYDERAKNEGLEADKAESTVRFFSWVVNMGPALPS